MKITKKEILQKLYNIEETTNLKLGREVQKVIRNEIIPIDVIKLINSHDKDFLVIYDTFNTIYNSKNRNPLYKNLISNNLNTEETAIALSSLITKILISCSKIENIEDRKIFATAMNIEEIQNAINDYIIYDKKANLIKCSDEIREFLKILY